LLKSKFFELTQKGRETSLLGQLVHHFTINKVVYRIWRKGNGRDDRCPLPG
jgi:hypothetical protein